MAIDIDLKSFEPSEKIPICVAVKITRVFYYSRE